MRHALITAAAFAAFALLHSLTVSRAFKRMVAGLLGGEWMRAYYRLLFTAFSAVITAAAAYVIFTQPDELLCRPGWQLYWPARLVQLAGVFLLFAAFRPFSPGAFTGLSQASEYLKTRRTGGDVEGVPQGPLIRSGAYSLVRHPMYTAGIIIFLAEPVVTVNSLVLRMMAAAYFVYGAFVEERRFALDFGEDYARYRREVPMFNLLAGVLRKFGRRGVFM